MSIISRKESIVIYSTLQRDSLLDKCIAQDIPYSIKEEEDPFTHKVSYIMKVRSKDTDKIFA